MQTNRRYGHDVTDEQWEGLAQVVPLRSRDEWPSWPGHPTMPRGMREPEQAQEEKRRFVVVRAEVFSDAREVAEYMMAGVPVLLDLTGAEGEVGRRILDFSSGVVFGQGSGMHRVDRNVFLLSPADTEVQGAAEESIPRP